MHARVTEFVETAEERYGLAIDPVEFPEKGTPTAADAAEAVDCEIAQIVNSLVFAVDGDPVLCLTSGGNRVSEAALAEWAGVDESQRLSSANQKSSISGDVEEAAVSMASPELVREATGWAIGGVPPLCHATDLPTLLDPDLLAFDRVWAAAGTPTSMWSVEPDRLQELAEAEAVEFTE